MRRQKYPIKTIAFTGDIKYHPDYFRIARFLEEKEIQYVSLKDEVLMDIGSFIPITEYIKIVQKGDLTNTKRICMIFFRYPVKQNEDFV